MCLDDAPWSCPGAPSKVRLIGGDTPKQSTPTYRGAAGDALEFHGCRFRSGPENTLAQRPVGSLLAKSRMNTGARHL